MNESDAELLREFAGSGSEMAFSELLRRHVDLVYSAARRQVGFDAQAAEDVTQTVFTDLARKAGRLREHPSLAGWLYTSTRLAATQYRRAETRRIARETAAHAMSHLLSDLDPDPDWNQLRAVLDDAMFDLDEADREAVLLRYFDKRPLTEVGARLELSENAARMRIERALGKLHAALTKRGIGSTSAALGLALGAHAVETAPLEMVGRISAATIVTGTKTAVGSAMAGKLLLTAFALVVATVALTLRTSRSFPAHSNPRRDNAAAAVAGQSTHPATRIAVTDAIEAASNMEPDTSPVGPNDRVLGLEFVDRQSGQPLTNLSVDYLCWERLGTQPVSLKLPVDQNGRVRVPVLEVIARLELTSRAEGWADTRLLWIPPQGDVIPSNRVVGVDRGVFLGGKVIDADGYPVAGAKVRLNELPPGPTGVESHAYGTVSVSTDELGNWQHTRIAADALKWIHGSATHPDHLPSEGLNMAEARDQEALLKSGSHVFQLQRAISIRGLVTDESGTPIAGAKVKVASIGLNALREIQTDSDGAFEARGCASSNLLVTAMASGRAPKTIRVVDPIFKGGPIRLVLGPPNILRFRVVTSVGQPLSNASFAMINSETPSNADDALIPPKTQVDYIGRTDANGRAEWMEAPSGTHCFAFESEGYRRIEEFIAADGEEHVVTLRGIRGLVVHGNIADATTGKPIKDAIMRIGRPDGYISEVPGGVSQRFYARFNEGDSRTWMRFASGNYRHTIPEENTDKPRRILKFEAEGYAPFFSRILDSDEGEVSLDVALEPSATFEITVLRPDGSPAAGAEVGLVRNGHRFMLKKYGISQQRGYSPSDLSVAASDGRLKLATDATVERVVAVDRAGFSSRTLSELAADHVFQLQPWASIEGEVIGSSARTNLVWIHGAHGSPQIFDLDFDRASQMPDGNGLFSFLGVPPGTWQVASIRPVLQTDGATHSSSGGDTVTITVAAGETAHARLRGGMRIRGRIQLPLGFSIPPASKWIGHASTPGPIPPAEIVNDPIAMRNWREMPENKALLDLVRVANTGIAPDGTFTLEAVQPGCYQMHITMFEFLHADGSPPRTTLKLYLVSATDFVVPEQSQFQEIDLGTLQASPPPKSEFPERDKGTAQADLPPGRK